MYITRPPNPSLLPKCSVLAGCYYSLSLPTTDKPPHRPLRSRPYATNTHHSWPTKPISQLTPYEIFNQPPSSIYQKSHFYQLVKLYHPDCTPPSDHPCSLLSKSTRTDRFRLIIAANMLLSDPTKKKAYDEFGVGWNSIPRHTDIRRRTAANYASGPWKTSPAGNATWEDWERWYKSESPTPDDTEPVTAHKNFVTVIMVLSFVGILVQLARLDQFNSSYEEKRDRKNRDIQRDLWRIRRDAMGKDGRVQAFLKMRDPEGYGGVEEVREERMRRLLPEGEVCLSDGIASETE
ncbi:hypothetical protein TWF481_004077 [Arthrobotrys musiformis]|uniref:J domain-containing protein n=1 Tax=Arthrobotrys musiformis TaxID=47236 RepID=A0AAV9WIH3_9PEZI